MRRHQRSIEPAMPSSAANRLRAFLNRIGPGYARDSARHPAREIIPH